MRISPSFFVKFLLATLISVLSLSASATTVNLVMRPPPDIQSLTINQARSIFSMRVRIWPDGTPITVYVLPEKDPKHTDFVRSLLTLLPHQLKRNWDRLVYTGIGQAPIEVANQQEMLERLRGTPGSIGYIDKGIKDDSLYLIALH